MVQMFYIDHSRRKRKRNHQIYAMLMQAEVIRRNCQVQMIQSTRPHQFLMLVVRGFLRYLHYYAQCSHYCGYQARLLPIHVPIRHFSVYMKCRHS